MFGVKSGPSAAPEVPGLHCVCLRVAPLIQAGRDKQAAAAFTNQHSAELNLISSSQNPCSSAGLWSHTGRGGLAACLPE